MNGEKDEMNVEEKAETAAKGGGGRRGLLVVLVLCLVVALSAAAFAAGKSAAASMRKGDAAEEVITQEITEHRTEYYWNDNGESGDPMAMLPSVKPVRNYLLVGIDNTYNMTDRGNADGIVIASINSETKQIVLTSLLRDIDVRIPDKYMTKLTMVYHDEGVKTLVRTVEHNFNIALDGYVIFSYLDVKNIVDALGGITLDLTPSEAYYTNEKLHDLCGITGADINKNLLSEAGGQYKLNGLQAAAYSRVRSTGNNDFARTDRVRSVILQLREKTMDLPVDELLELYGKLMSGLKTDIPQGELMELALNSTTYLGYETVSQKIPIDGTSHTENLGGAMLVIDFEANNRYLHSTIYEGKPPESVDEITVLGETK